MFLIVVVVVVDFTRTTHTWRALGPGASANVDDCLIGRLGVVGPQCGCADALAQPGLTVALLDHLHLPGPLEQQHAVHTHPGGFAHSVHAARVLLVVRLRILRGCGSAAFLLMLVQTCPTCYGLKNPDFIQGFYYLHALHRWLNCLVCASIMALYGRAASLLFLYYIIIAS